MNDRIRRRRLQLELTQQQLAKMLGVSRVSVTKWESGAVKPAGENLHQLALVVQHFGGVVKVAEALGLKHPAVSRWGNVIPEKQAMRLERITKRALRYDPKLYISDVNKKASA